LKINKKEIPFKEIEKSRNKSQPKHHRFTLTPTQGISQYIPIGLYSSIYRVNPTIKSNNQI